MAKIDANIDGLDDLIRSLKTKQKARVGIIGAKAKTIHDSKSGLTNAQLGAVHEFGATINHPGGQPYYIDQRTKRTVFLSKDIPFSENLPHTKPHTINIPARSFLYEPLMEKLSADATAWKKEAWKDFFIKNKPEDFFNYLIGISINIVQGAFDTGGYGQWKELTAASKKRKRGTNKTLVDTGSLKGSISGKVYKR